MRPTLLAIVGLIALAAPVSAGPKEDCAQPANLDLRIEGCTAVIAAPVGDKATVVTAYISRAVAHMRKGSLDLATADFDKAIETDPANARGYGNRCGFKNNRKDYAGAIADCTKAIEIDPKYALAYHNRCVSHENSSAKDAAIADCSKAIELQPSYPDALAERGYLYEKDKKADKALADYTAAIAINTNHRVARINRCIVNRNLGKYDDAIADCNVVIAQYPKEPRGYHNLAEVYEKQKDKPKAIAEYKRALEADPKFEASLAGLRRMGAKP